MAVRLRQPFPRVLSSLGFKDNDAQIQYCGLINAGVLGPFGTWRNPMPCPGVVKALSIYGCGEMRSGDYVVTLMHNGVATSTAVTIPATQTGLNVITLSEPFVTGDYLGLAFSGAQVTFPGYDLGICAEIEIPSGLMMFGTASFAGGVVEDSGKIGGAFGNGIFQDWGGSGGSNTYSLDAVDGTAVTMSMNRYTVPVGGRWIAYLVVDGIPQDGTGGTVDTSCVLEDADANDLVTSQFVLPLVIQKQYDVLVVRTGSGSGFQLEHVGVGVGIRPSTPGQFMLCGGSNDTIPNSGTTWKWVSSLQNAANIGQHTAPVGMAGFTAKSFFIRRSFNTGLGATATHTLLRNGEESSLVVPLGPSDSQGSDTGRVAYTRNGLITVEVVSTGSPASGQLHWGIGATPPDQVLGPIAWMEWQRVNP